MSANYPIGDRIAASERKIATQAARITELEMAIADHWIATNSVQNRDPVDVNPELWAVLDAATPAPTPQRMERRVRLSFWKFVHNTLIHPLLGLCGPWQGPAWLLRAHDWTSDRCPGHG